MGTRARTVRLEGEGGVGVVFTLSPSPQRRERVVISKVAIEASESTRKAGIILEHLRKLLSSERLAEALRKADSIILHQRRPGAGAGERATERELARAVAWRGQGLSYSKIAAQMKITRRRAVYLCTVALERGLIRSA